MRQGKKVTRIMVDIVELKLAKTRKLTFRISPYLGILPILGPSNCFQRQFSVPCLKTARDDNVRLIYVAKTTLRFRLLNIEKNGSS